MPSILSLLPCSPSRWSTALGRALRAGVAGLSALSMAACEPVEVMRPAEPDPDPVSWPAPRSAARIFISGHSLTDVPMPDDLAAIAGSLSTPAWINQQLMVGSTLRSRTRGTEGSEPWSGYRQGSNRQGQGMDVLAELRAPQTVPGPYDVLMLTERHDLGGVLMWEDTVRALRHFHERARDANPQVSTYFFEPWSDVRDKSDPADWLRYERRASPLWRCMADRVNVSLAADGRADRLLSIPAGAALAELVDRATPAPGKPGLPGLTQPRVADTLALLFRDKVHPTRLGSYYIALVNYAAIYRRSPVGAWAPSEVSPEQALSLQTVAWSHISAHQAEAAAAKPMTLAACRAEWQTFCGEFWDHWAQREPWSLKAAWRTRRFTQQCRQVTSALDAGNPLYFDPQGDREGWWSAPPAAGP